MTARARPCPAGGFTLLELVVALAVLALLTLLLAGGVRSSLGLLDRAATRSEALEDLPLAHQALRRILAGALPVTLPPPRDDEPAPVRFAGDATGLELVGHLPEPAGGGTWRIALGIRDEDAGRRLVLRWRPLDATGDSAAGGEAILLERIAGLRLAYLGADGPGLSPAWADSWRGREKLPRLVRVEVSFPAGDERLWPPLVVAPMVRTVP
ncbi:MAG: prepilin-type N-terminal cleavage/methylation domain-containing protein [Geminicoccaceae bacterium]